VKRKKLFFLIVLMPLVVALCLAPKVMAQDDPPSENGPLMSTESNQPQLVPMDEKSSISTGRAATGRTRDLTPKTGILDIAISDDFEGDSDIAFGNSVYGIAYARAGHIYVAFYNANGHFLSRYPVTGGNASNSHPAIAYEGTNNLFVVAYDFDFGGGDVDIYVRAVSPFSGCVGLEKPLTGSSLNFEADPDLDCNHEDTSCLVVFSHSGTEKYIQGRFVDVTSVGVNAIADDPFRVSSTNNKEGPHVAWGWNNDRYMVVYHAPPSSGEDDSFFTHVYETYQSTGNQYIFPSTSLYNTAIVEHDNIATEVTYDPVTEKFLTLVNHDFYGDATDYDVHLYVHSATSNAVYTPTGLVVADWAGGIDETQGSISFLTNAWSAQSDIGPDKVAIAYLRSSSTTEIVTTVITGNGSKTSPGYDIPEEVDHALVKDALGTFGSFVTDPAVAGSDGSGCYLVTLTDHIPGIAIDDEDIKGMILCDKSGSNIYLPLIIK
jgi:hypothetical protein